MKSSKFTNQNTPRLSYRKILFVEMIAHEKSFKINLTILVPDVQYMYFLYL